MNETKTMAAQQQRLQAFQKQITRYQQTWAALEKEKRKVQEKLAEEKIKHQHSWQLTNRDKNILAGVQTEMQQLNETVGRLGTEESRVSGMLERVNEELKKLAETRKDDEEGLSALQVERREAKFKYLKSMENLGQQAERCEMGIREGDHSGHEFCSRLVTATETDKSIVASSVSGCKNADSYNGSGGAITIPNDEDKQVVEIPKTKLLLLCKTLEFCANHVYPIMQPCEQCSSELSRYTHPAT